jgi:2'-5' RNA ligase
LTLGRFKQSVNPNTIRRVLQEFGDLIIEDFTARRVIFYKSDLKPPGAVYSQLQQAVLE